MRHSRKSLLTRAGVFGALALLLSGILFPVVWMVLTAFKTRPESMKRPPALLPEAWQLDNFRAVFDAIPFAAQMLNTVVVTAATVLFTVIIAAMAAFALEVVRLPGRHAILVGLLAVTMVPSQIFMLPQYQIFVWWEMTDTLAALVIPSIFSALGAFLLAQAMRSFPRDIVEAAHIDGAGYLRVFVSIVLPNIKGPIAALAVMTMLASWDDLLWPLIVNRTPEKLTLAPGLTQLQGSYVSNVPLMLAAGTMSVVPMILLFLAMQREFTESFTMSGMK